MRLCLILSLVVLAGLYAAGCAASEEAATSVRTTVEVVNLNFNDMNIYILRSGQRIRLGFVPGKGTRTLTIPAYIADTAASFQFLADPVGGNSRPVSQEMYVTPGEQVRLIIPAI